MNNKDDLIGYIRVKGSMVIRGYFFESIVDSIPKIAGDITKYMNELHDEGYNTDYVVACDDTNNTEETIGENKLRVDVAFKIDGDDSFIHIPFRSEPTSVVF